MRATLTRWWRRYWPIGLMVLVELALLATNYKPGTYLVGWDGVYPEFNFPLNFKRGWFAIWQEYRGVGLLDGMAHAANLPHTVFLCLLHFFLPAGWLRYVFVFLMHFAGGVGMYLLLDKVVFREKREKRIISLWGAWFYQFNLATIQIFYAPLEAFVVHFGFLPFLIWRLISFLEKPNRKNLIYFMVLSLLAVPQGFVPQVFLVYLMMVGWMLLVFGLKNGRKAVRRVLTVILLIGAVNAYWGLPYVYSASHNARTIMEAKINQMSSGDVFSKNQVRGTLKDVVLLRGFMLDVSEYLKDEGRFDYIMGEWRERAESGAFEVGSEILGAIAVLGLVFVVVKRRWELFPFAASYLVAVFFWGSNVWGLRDLNQILREGVPVIGEAFRFSFTKFAVVLAFSYSLFLAVGAGVIWDFLKGKRFLRVGLVLVLVGGLWFYAYPVFEGRFLFDSVRLAIPKEYLQSMEFFKQWPVEGRVAIFPQQSFWSWRHLDWGYRGSGFMWYGVEQPWLSRAFDPWSDESENYYWEITYALYSKNLPLFESVLSKYQIGWIWVDGHMLNTGGVSRALYFDELAGMLERSEKVEAAADYGKIRIYRVEQDVPMNNFVFAAGDLPVVGPEYEWGNYDRAYLEYGDYVTFPTSEESPELENEKSVTPSEVPQNQDLVTIYYPFRSLFTGRGVDEREFEVGETADELIFTKQVAEEVASYKLVVGEFDDKELMEVNPEDLGEVKYLIPQAEKVGNVVEVRVPKVKGLLTVGLEAAGPESRAVKEDTEEIARECNFELTGEVRNEVREGWLRLYAKDAINCSASFWLPDLIHRNGYLIKAESRNVKGKPLLFWIENLNSRKADLETYLPRRAADFPTIRGVPTGHLGGVSQPTTNHSYFIQPPMEEDGLGYSLHFDNISIGREEAVNELGKVEVWPIPYRFLTSLRLVRDTQDAIRKTEYQAVGVEHPNPSLYVISLSTSGESKATPEVRSPMLVLSQVDDEGWKAYVIRDTQNAIRSKLNIWLAPIWGEEIKEHVKVNNWENGWELDANNQQPTANSQQIIIVYWPQYLEYIGFLLLAAGAIAVLIWPFWEKE